LSGRDILREKLAKRRSCEKTPKLRAQDLAVREKSDPKPLGMGDATAKSSGSDRTKKRRLLARGRAGNVVSKYA